MLIELKKFGTTLTTRQAGNEALKALRSTLHEIKTDENIKIDFDGVLTFSPSWGDEFLTPLLHEFDDRLQLLTSDNLSVKTTITLLEQINKQKFKWLNG